MATHTQTETTTTAQPRRVTVVTPTTRVDLALPLQATVAEVVTQVVSLVGLDDADPAGSAGGWLLSRLGDSPFVAGRSVVATDIADGDVLYLTRRSDRLPPALFDDVIDAVAEATRTRADGWTAAATRRTAVAAAAALAVAGTAVTATAGAPWGGAVAIAVTVAAVLVIAGGAISRAAGDSVVGAVVAMAALPAATWAAARSVTDPAALVPSGPAALLLAGAALTLTAVVAAIAVGDALTPFLAVVVAGSTATVAGLVALVGGVPALHVASATAVLAMLAVPGLPMLAVRLARLPWPTIPVDMAEFRRDETVTTGEEMLTVARRTQGLLTALVVAVVAIQVPCLVVLVLDGSPWSLVLATVLGLALALRARQLLGVVARLTLLVAGLAVPAAVAAVLLADGEHWWRLAAAPAAVLVATAVVGYGLAVPRRAASPYAGRLLDVTEFLAVAALLPLLGVVLGLYARARGLGG
jgi:type VII secretion integral membrane protein EccD